MAATKKTLKPVGNKLVFQHNNLIRTPLKMGMIESRIFLQALSHIDRETKEFPTSIIPISSVMRELTNSEDYADIKKACDSLVGRILDLVPAHERKGRTHKVPLMSEVESVKGTGTIRVSFNEKAKPYLLELKEAGFFTSADVTTLLNFKSPTSARLYWILKSWSGMGEGPVAVHQHEIEELKWWLLEQEGLYPLYTEFKRRVLDPIAEEFAAVGFGATWEPVRTGKKTSHLKFTIPREAAKAPKLTSGKQLALGIEEHKPQPAPTPEATKPAQRLLATLGTKYDLADWQLKVVGIYLTQGNSEQIAQRPENVKDFLKTLVKAKATATWGGYVWASLVEKFPYLKRIQEELTTQRAD